MLTYNAKASVSKNHELEVRMPTDLDEGEYTVIIKVNEHLRPSTPRRTLTFGSLHLGAMTDETFRREDIYDDDGR